uniref:EF-hand domain-containing protein n=1 Tax=Clastoptera arizonana TaxID=38151 RepID=A0A1B6CQV9_9HEMI
MNNDCEGYEVRVRVRKVMVVVRSWCYACQVLLLQNGTDLDGHTSPKFPYKPWKHPRPRSYNKNYSKESLSSQKSTGPPPHTTLQRHTKANRSLLIPRFHYPQGKPSNQTQLEVTLEAVRQVFQTFPNQQVTKDSFSTITKAAGCPLYWKAPLFIACGGEKLGYVELNTFLDYWRNLCSTCHDSASRFMHILTRSVSRNYLLPEDLMSLVQDVVDTHPGLTFLKEAAEFHSRYVHTVISRVYYCVNQSWSGQITLTELRRSDFLRVVQLLESEDDINQVTQYFSYEHFYVIYCKFWELDRDHDLFIDKNDLARHSDHALSTRLIDRIFSGTVTRGKTANNQQSQLNGQPDAKMSYTEFVWFLLAEEDKQHPRAIEYWFRCMDLDGDGYLSMYELEYFYDEQLQRMEAVGIECLPFEDCLCQMLDMIRPATPGKISLNDLKKCKMTPIFFDTFFNLEKYLDHEQRDPFASQRDHDTEMSDWDRYAAEEYELLVAEEGGNDNPAEFGDEDGDEDALSPNLDHILSSHTYTNNNQDSGTNKPRSKHDWSQPSLTVTDFDYQDGSSSDSADYAADSDDCSM